MTKTRILLGSALVLSLLAVVSLATKPRAPVARPGEALTAQGGP